MLTCHFKFSFRVIEHGGSRFRDATGDEQGGARARRDDSFITLEGAPVGYATWQRARMGMHVGVAGYLSSRTACVLPSKGDSLGTEAVRKRNHSRVR